jgi:hypothetical protein
MLRDLRPAPQGGAPSSNWFAFLGEQPVFVKIWFHPHVAAEVSLFLKRATEELDFESHVYLDKVPSLVPHENFIRCLGRGCDLSYQDLQGTLCFDLDLSSAWARMSHGTIHHPQATLRFNFLMTETWQHGETLSQWIPRMADLGEYQALRSVAEQLQIACANMATQNLRHNDISCCNILVVGGVAKIFDWNWASDEYKAGPGQKTDYDFLLTDIENECCGGAVEFILAAFLPKVQENPSVP